MLNEEFYKRFNIESLIQKEDFAGYFFDRFVIPELLEIQRRADLVDVSILFIKGLVERYDTYKDLHLNRHMCDIDLLVSINDINCVCNIMKELGYKPLYEDEITDDWVEAHISNLTSHHLPPIEKRIVNNSVPLQIEVHTVLTPHWNRLADRNMLTAEILKQKCVPSKELGLYGMDICNRIAFSFLYFTNDFLPNLLTFYYCPQNQLFNGKTLLDAYLILQKYENQIDYDLLVDRIRFYGLEYDALLAAKLMNELFESPQTSKLLDCLSCNLNNTVPRTHSEKVLYGSYLAVDGICDKDDIDFYKSTVSNSISQNKNISVIKGKNAVFELNGAVNNNVNITWDDFGISIELDLKINDIEYWADNVEEYDGVNLRIYNPDYDIERDNAVRNIFVCFKKNAIGEIIPDVSFNQKDPTRKGTLAVLNVVASIKQCAEHCKIAITVPWSLQSIDPTKTSYLGFDCTVHLVKSNEKGTLLYWSTNEEPYYNPAKFGRISLENP